MGLGIFRFYLDSNAGKALRFDWGSNESGMKLQVSFSPSQKFKYETKVLLRPSRSLAPRSASNQVLQRNGAGENTVGMIAMAGEASHL